MNQIPPSSSFDLGSASLAAARSPRLLVDLGTRRLIAANAAARDDWGLGADPAAEPEALTGVDPPLLLDTAMPAIRDLAALAGAEAVAWQGPLALVFWTPRGIVRWTCFVRAADDAPSFRSCGAPVIVIAAPVAGDESRDVPAAATASTDQAPTPAPLAQLAHELRTPLSAIASIAEVLSTGSFGQPGDPRYAEYARAIGDTARHAIGVVESMLGPAVKGGMDDRTITELDLNALARAAVRSLERLALKRRSRLACDFATGLPRVIADGVGVRQILLNLISNALTHSGEAVAVTVRSGVTGRGEVWVEVEDDGAGDAERITAAIAGERRQGSSNDRHGIGLPLAGEIARRNGAALTCVATIPRGVRVRLAFEPSRGVPV